MLEKIQKPNDIKKIPADQLPALAEEIREFIIESLSKTGGTIPSKVYSFPSRTRAMTVRKRAFLFSL